jgi:hypothetical protein
LLRFIFPIIYVAVLFYTSASLAQPVPQEAPPVTAPTKDSSESSDILPDEFSLEYERFAMYRRKGAISAGVFGCTIGLAGILAIVSFSYAIQNMFSSLCDTDECREEEEKNDNIAMGFGIASLATGTIGLVGLFVGLGYRTHGKNGRRDIESKRRQKTRMQNAQNTFKPELLSIEPIITSEFSGGMLTFSF